MSSTWNGKSLVDKWLRKYGFRDEASKIRTIDFINDIQKDIACDYQWPFHKIKIKKQIDSGDQEIDIAPQIPTAPTIALSNGGSITDEVVVSLKVTFVIFDESGREVKSIESEPSIASNVVTTANPDRQISVTDIDTYDGLTSIQPTVIHRRLYLKVGSSPYYLAKTLEDNSTVSTTITADPSTTYEPPEYSLVAFMGTENPLIENSGIYLNQVDMDKLNQYDPNLSSSGTPASYARTSKDKIFLYPKPSGPYTLTYYVFKIPSRIFYDTDRPIQLDPSLKEVLEAGVTWKFYEDKDSDGQESKEENYRARILEAQGRNKTNGQFPTVRRVC